MGSSLLPIMLIVVLVVGATVFVILSSRSGQTNYGPGGAPMPTRRPARDERAPGRRTGRRRDRQGDPRTAGPGHEPAVGDRYSADAAGLVPGFEQPGPTDGRIGRPAPAPASKAAGAPTEATAGAGTVGPEAVHDLDARGADLAWSDHVTTQVSSGDGGWPDDPEATGWAPPPRGPPHPGSSRPEPAAGAATAKGLVDPEWAAADDAWTIQASASQPPTPPEAAWPGSPAVPPGQPAAPTQPVPPVQPVPAAQPVPPVPPARPAPPPATPFAPPSAASPASAASTEPTGPPVGPGVTTTGPYVADEPEHPSAPPLRLAAAGRTRRGKRGGPNEDAFVVVDGLLAVSDGVGGEAAGQIASTLAVTTVAGFRPQYAADPREGLRAAVDRANRVVRDRPRSEPSWRGMACTLDVVILGRQETTGRTITVAHVGDSTVWLQPGKGEPRQLTTPHAITGGPLLNAIGLADEIEMDLFQVEVQAGDRVVLSSDGMTKVMKSEQLYGLLHQLASDPPERAADALVEAALLAGARDDTTVVVADLVPEPAPR